MIRRDFLKNAAAEAATAAALLSGAVDLSANALNLPVGLQLYTVRQELAKDFNGTLKQVAAIGYREVEAAGFYGMTAPVFLRSLHDVGLQIPSAHFSMTQFQSSLGLALDYSQRLGLSYMICSSPAMPPHRRRSGGGHFAMTMDDWKWNADQLNRIGAVTKKAGIQLGYHNHFLVFQKIGGVVPYDQLLRWCDPNLVKFEIDIGWMVFAGADPVHYMTHYPGRFPELHVKGVKKGYKPSERHGHGFEFPTAELGRGQIDWKRIFAVAPKAGVKHYYVEQESFPDMPPMAAIKADYQYLHQLKG